jgi:hypothetical protein
MLQQNADVQALGLAWKEFLKSTDYERLKGSKSRNDVIFCTYRWEGVQDWKGKPSILVCCSEGISDPAKQVLPECFNFFHDGKMYTFPIAVVGGRFTKLIGTP